MYVKKRKNISGSTSVQVIEKLKGKSCIVRTIGSSKELAKIKEYELEAKDFISEQKNQLPLELRTNDKERPT